MYNSMEEVKKAVATQELAPSTELRFLEGVQLEWIAFNEIKLISHQAMQKVIGETIMNKYFQNPNVTLDVDDRGTGYNSFYFRIVGSDRWGNRLCELTLEDSNRYDDKKEPKWNVSFRNTGYTIDLNKERNELNYIAFEGQVAKVLLEEPTFITDLIKYCTELETHKGTLMNLWQLDHRISELKNAIEQAALQERIKVGTIYEGDPNNRELLYIGNTKVYNAKRIEITKVNPKTVNLNIVRDGENKKEWNEELVMRAKEGIINLLRYIDKAYAERIAQETKTN